MEKRFKQLIKLQLENTDLIERELLICRLARIRSDKYQESYESKLYGFAVTYTEEKGVFVYEKKKLSKLKVLNRSRTLIGKYNSKKEAKEILAELGDTKIEYNEDERMWIVKKANIEAVLYGADSGEIIECSYPYLPEVEEGEENEFS